MIILPRKQLPRGQNWKQTLGQDSTAEALYTGTSNSKSPSNHRWATINSEKAGGVPRPHHWRTI